MISYFLIDIGKHGAKAKPLLKYGRHLGQTLEFREIFAELHMIVSYSCLGCSTLLLFANCNVIRVIIIILYMLL